MQVGPFSDEPVLNSKIRVVNLWFPCVFYNIIILVVKLVHNNGGRCIKQPCELVMIYEYTCALYVCTYIF